MSTFRRTAAALCAAGLVLAPVATAQAQSLAPETGTSRSSLDPGPPEVDRLPPWAFEALHYGPMSQAEVDACWDGVGDVIIMIYPGPCPDAPISHLEYHAAQVLWFFTAHLGR